jgi:hypothetical protein
MKSYSFGIEIKPDGIQYAEMEFNMFVAREVLRNGTAIGEYHIKIKDNSSLVNAVKYFKHQFPDCDVGLIDPEGLLNLEYPIYLLVKNRLILDSIVDIFTEIDKELRN